MHVSGNYYRKFINPNCYNFKLNRFMFLSIHNICCRKCTCLSSILFSLFSLKNISRILLLYYARGGERKWLVNVHPNAAALFAASVVTTIEDGANTFFWTYLWLHGAMDSPSPSLLLLWLEQFPNVWLEREQSRRLCNIHFGLVTSKDSCRSRS